MKRRNAYIARVILLKIYESFSFTYTLVNFPVLV